MMRVGVSWLLIGILVALVEAFPHPFTGRVSYQGHQVWRCLFNSPIHAEDFRSIADEKQLDIWKFTRNETHVRGTKDALESLKDSFDCNTLVEDLQAILDLEEEQSQSHFRTRASPNWFDRYHSFEEIVDYLGDLKQQYPDLVTLIPSIGKSVEGRDIPVIRIKGTTESVKTVFFSGGMHAREWISISTVLYVATKLLEGSHQKEVTDLLKSLEFVIAPCVNPDGYSYSFQRDRMWRKNRRPPPPSAPYCYGVDLNRNFDNHWGGVGASPYPCAEDYRGPSVASEPETQAIQNFVLTLPNRSGGIDFHSYGQLILRSFGYSYSNSPNEQILSAIGNEMRSTIQKVSGRWYSSQRAAELYPTTGSTDDWFTETGGMWGWTIELRDTGVYGFRLPADQIISTGEEIWEAMKYFARILIEKGPSSN